ncbi:MAG: EscU/YscU/HrcU family type III secretion system export apparatus switch protein [Pseudomonadota bacterium]
MTRKQQKKAVALRYDYKRDTVPRVTAKGAGPVAQKILDLANEHGVPIKQDPDLVEVLSRLDIQEEIPADIYVAVAELLAFIYAMNSKKSA